jgi:hypothetical protein
MVSSKKQVWVSSDSSYNTKVYKPRRKGFFMKQKTEFRDPTDMELGILVQEMNSWDEYEVNSELHKYNMVLDGLNRLPRLLRPKVNEGLISSLAFNEEFCKWAGLSHKNINDHASQIDFALRIFYGQLAIDVD